MDLLEEWEWVTITVEDMVLLMAWVVMVSVFGYCGLICQSPCVDIFKLMLSLTQYALIFPAKQFLCFLFFFFKGRGGGGSGGYYGQGGMSGGGWRGMY